ncbi:ROK family protein [Xenophilus arseniciresistens]|uniref:ROK family protein n=1 Tax=Xenophilus arseniciresistens TaxID=1283306 RepID=A0AAE3N972_9BURK|nr:ROK family protein [Xenophilus arseniciresistens]MDA7417466.1 ROK family protein [Xenophilus arseniciresistens]
MHHGALKLEMLEIAGYNLEVADGEGFIGDRASQTAFRALLDQWRRRYRSKGLADPLGKRPSSALGKKVLDRAIGAERASPAADIVHGVIEEFAVELAQVIQRFMRQKSWSGVQRIVIGGGFPESDVGERAILQAAALCEAAELPVHLARLSHHVDDGGLIGWVHLAPAGLAEHYDALLAIDLGGTNARCGIVSFRRNKAADFSRARVERRVKWRHADDDPSRTGLVQGLATLLEEQIAWAARKKLRLAPFVGIACPGLIRADGSIARGAQNLPGNWAADSFHLPTALREALPVIDGHATQVLMHNDAVVQGLSEVPRMRDVKRWAVLTIGTGLGNASYVNRRVAREAAA